MELKDFKNIAYEISEIEKSTFDLWTWLPSRNKTEEKHGDYYSEHAPKTYEVINEAIDYIYALQETLSKNGINYKNIDLEKFDDNHYMLNCSCGCTFENE